MTKAGSTRGLSRVIPKILVEAMSGELTLNALSTHWFLRQSRKVSGYDTKTFAEQWIYGSGCPKFTFKYHFNRKKMVVEIDMTQENSSATSALPTDVISDVNSPLAFQETVTPLFTGNFIARIHEADGTPYEHILDIQTSAKRFEVQFNTKYKRIRRNTKRFQAKQAAAAAAAAEEEQMEGEEGENISSIVPSLGLGMPLFEEDTYRREWRLVEWGQEEDDTSGAASATFDWIRLDAEFEWICTIKFEQPDYMWAAQLTKDWDVVAQYEVSR
jgi:transcription initiation factor TFIID subunit 2